MQPHGTKAASGPVIKQGFQELTECRICGCEQLTEVLDLGTQFLTGVFPRTPDAEVTRGSVTLVLCGECHLLQLGEIYDLSEMYGLNYGYRSGLNASMVKHLLAKVSGLTSLVDLKSGDVVLDIGSNDGTLLGAYPKKDIRLIGFDPSGPKFSSFYPEGAELFPEFFSADCFLKGVGGPAKIVTSVAMFYDLPKPQDFVNDIASVLADDGIWHTEQSYLPTMLSANSYDTACQEHLEYYGLSQLKWLADRAGLRIIDVSLNDINGGSFAVTLAKSDSSYPDARGKVDEILKSEADAGLMSPSPYRAFARRVETHRDHLVALVKELRESGKTVIGYGASTKGNVLLQYCGFTSKDISCIAEVNPDKYGCFTPGTWIPIVSEEDAAKLRPDYMLVLPWHFRDGIIRREAEYLNQGGKFIFPLPTIEIVGAE
jgi:hypothetical protein